MSTITVYSAYAEQEDSYQPLARMIDEATPQLSFKSQCLLNLSKGVITEMAIAMKKDNFFAEFLKGMTKHLIDFVSCQFSLSTQVSTETVISVIIDAIGDFLTGKDPVKILVDLIKRIWELSQGGNDDNGTVEDGPQNNPVDRC